MINGIWGPRRTGEARWHRRTLLTVGGALLLIASFGPAAPVAAEGLRWHVGWDAPVDTGPSPVALDLVLTGRISPPSGQIDPTGVLTIRTSLPEACTPTPGPVVVVRERFRIEPGLRCNGSYDLTMTTRAKVLGLPLPARGPDLSTTLVVADGGPAPAAPTVKVAAGGTDVEVRFSGTDRPDVVGHRIFRDGTAIADLPADATSFVDERPGAGRHTYTVRTRFWGADGPGGAEVQSPSSSPAAATITAPADPGDGGGPTSGSSSGGTPQGGASGGSSESGGAGGRVPGPGGSGAAPAPLRTDVASPSAPTRGGRRSGGSAPPRSTRHRSGSSAGPTTPTTGPEVFEERLPYQPRTERELVATRTPDSSRTVMVEEPVRRRVGSGLLMPAALFIVLLAGAVQIRSLLRRSRPTAEAMTPLADP